jgi:hypothetical protein
MYPESTRVAARDLVRSGLPVSDVSRRLEVSRAAVRDWRDGTTSAPRVSECPWCEDVPLVAIAYAALLGFYLGDGCLSRAPRYWTLRISCDASLPGIVSDVERMISNTRPSGRIHLVSAPGAVVVQSNWKHWRRLLPQHGPGRKHERPIVLEAWQKTIVEANPADFLRGLFHSDGCRANNWTRRLVAGEMKRYDYPRWQFTNHSADIRELCCWALDLVEVPWRQSNWKTISVSTRSGVSLLDELIGLKS